jgi:diguanylate cyclase (GGDEF)-like protein
MLAGKVIAANMRRMDVAARYGGDEFVLLLPHAGSAEASGAAQRINEEYKQASAILLNRSEGVSMSIGIGSIFDNHPPHADKLISLADTALYRAKDHGRDRIMLSEIRGPGMPATWTLTPKPNGETEARRNEPSP